MPAIKCDQCDGKAIYDVGGGHLLCLNCFIKYQDINIRTIEALQHQRNQILDAVDETIGLPVTRRRYVQTPRYIQDPRMTVNNNININNSKVGVLNTGHVRQIELMMDRIEQNSSQDLARALRAFAQSITHSDGVDPDTRNELLEQVAEISAQAALPPAERKKGILKALVDSVNNSAGIVATLTDTWGKLQPMLQGLW